MTRTRVDRELRSRGKPRCWLPGAVTSLLACPALLLMLAVTVAADQTQVRELLVDWADTAEEHVASVHYYTERAEESRQEVLRHEEMGDRYAKGKMKSRDEQAAHCERIASLHGQLVIEYEALAQNHRKEAERLEREASGKAQ